MWSVQLAGLSALTGLRELTCQGDRPKVPVLFSGQLPLGTSLPMLAAHYYQPLDCIPEPYTP